MRREELQYGLRGIDPTNGKDLPYEVEALDGTQLTVDQHSVDNGIFIKSVRSQIQHNINTHTLKKR